MHATNSQIPPLAEIKQVIARSISLMMQFE